MFEIRPLSDTDLDRLAEIDVSESGSVVYALVHGELRSEPEVWQRPRWDAAAWRRKYEEWQRTLKMDLLLGAFDGERLVGMASLRYALTETMAQLTTLHVDRTHRQQGVAKALVQEVIRLVKEAGAASLYVSATPSASALGFYRSQGFELVDEPHPQLFELEPEDIHMVKNL